MLSIAHSTEMTIQAGVLQLGEKLAGYPCLWKRTRENSVLRNNFKYWWKLVFTGNSISQLWGLHISVKFSLLHTRSASAQQEKENAATFSPWTAKCALQQQEEHRISQGKALALYNLSPKTASRYFTSKPCKAWIARCFWPLPFKARASDHLPLTKVTEEKKKHPGNRQDWPTSENYQFMQLRTLQQDGK